MKDVEKKKNRRKLEIQRIVAWILLVLIEIAAAAAPAILLAAILVPMARAERGYEAIGGEWFAIGTAFCITYTAIHNRICDKIFEEEKR